MKENIRKIRVIGDVDTCPGCGYNRGFHTSLVAEAGDVWVIFICPDCGKRYNPKLKINEY